MSGFPAFGSDTTGYRGTPTRESTLRWMEHTALSVVMQVYEDGARLPWSYDDAAGAEYQAMATLHQQLEPYNAILVRGAQTSGAPTLRPLPLAGMRTVPALTRCLRAARLGRGGRYDRARLGAGV